jgi:hypothetical protein
VATVEHYHTLERVKDKSKKLFRCLDPECFYANHRDFLIGKKFMCPFCGDIYILTMDMARRKLPHCRKCTRPVSESFNKKFDTIKRIYEKMKGEAYEV